MLETPETVGEWIRATFPEWSGPQGRALAIVEEAVELALASGLSHEQIQSAVNLSFHQDTTRKQQSDYVPESDEGEVADIMLNLYAYANEQGYNIQASLDKKMEKNRKKSFYDYQQKTQLKKRLGLQLPTQYRVGQPCSHPGCLNHVTHPCDGCGRYRAGLPA